MTKIKMNECTDHSPFISFLKWAAGPQQKVAADFCWLYWCRGEQEVTGWRSWSEYLPCISMHQHVCHADLMRCTVGKWTSIEHSVDSWNMFHSYSCNYCQSNLFYRSSFKSAGCSETEIVGKKNDRLIQRSEYQSDINAPNAERWPSYSCKCSCFCLFVCVCNLQMAYSSMDLQEHDWNLVFCVCGVCFMSILVSVWM